jgi:short subunit dehydrogenase-like uncharacterized protein
MRLLNPIKKIFTWPFMQKLLKLYLAKFVKKGPSSVQRIKEKTNFWGYALDDAGNKATITITAPNVYELTAQAGILIAKHCLNTSNLKGYYTPTMLLGADAINLIDGIEVRFVD